MLSRPQRQRASRALISALCIALWVHSLFSTSLQLIALQSGGANPHSHFLYPRSKGLTEIELAGLGYDETIVFRPGMLLGTDRGESRPAESIIGYVLLVYLVLMRSPRIKRPIFGALSYLTSSVASSVRTPLRLFVRHSHGNIG